MSDRLRLAATAVASVAAGYALRVLVERIASSMRSSPTAQAGDNVINSAATKQGDVATAAFQKRMRDYRQGANVLHLLFLGERLGAIDALLQNGALTSEALAKAAGIHPRYAKEWTLCMAANSVLNYDAENHTFAIKPELCAAFRDQGTLAVAPGLVALIMRHESIYQAYKTGKGIGWGEYGHFVSQASRRMFGPLYENHLVSNLPPAVYDALAAVQGGATPPVVADIGCGEALSTMVLAQHFPQCKFVGYDLYDLSVELATQAAQAKGLTSNLSFVCASAEASGEANSVDVVLFFDCFHDLPVATAAAKNAYKILKPGGMVFLIELNSSEEDSVEALLKVPTTAAFSCFSCQVCLCVGMCDEGDALGTVVPTARLRDIFVRQAGFASLEVVKNAKFDGLGFRQILVRK